jgi:hypothetical protein
VRYDEQFDTFGRIDTESIQIVQRHRTTLRLGETRIDDDPLVLSEMEHDTLPLPWAEKGEFEFVCSRGISLGGAFFCHRY